MKTNKNDIKSVKKPYKSPKLIEHGSIEKITKVKEKPPKSDGSKMYSHV